MIYRSCISVIVGHSRIGCDRNHDLRYFISRNQQLELPNVLPMCNRAGTQKSLDPKASFLSSHKLTVLWHLAFQKKWRLPKVRKHGPSYWQIIYIYICIITLDLELSNHIALNHPMDPPLRWDRFCWALRPSPFLRLQGLPVSSKALTLNGLVWKPTGTIREMKTALRKPTKPSFYGEFNGDIWWDIDGEMEQHWFLLELFGFLMHDLWIIMIKQFSIVIRISRMIIANPKRWKFQ